MRLPSSKLVSIQPQQPQHQPNLPRSRGEGQREQLGVLPVALPSARLPETREQVPPSEPRRAQFAADASRRRRTSRLSNKLQNSRNNSSNKSWTHSAEPSPPALTPKDIR